MEEVKEIAKLVLKQGRKRKDVPVTLEKEKKNWEPEIRVIKPLPRPIEASIPSPPLSPIQHLRNALESLSHAYQGLEGESKEQVDKLGHYVQCIIRGENPFIKEKENKEKDALEGLVEEVKALYKKIAPIKETYTKKLKKNPPSSSSTSVSLLFSLPSFTPILPTSLPLFTFTKSKKKQL